MIMLSFVGVLALISVTKATLPFKFSDCSAPTANKLGYADHISLSNDPIPIPGNETVSLDVHILREITGNYTVNLRVQRHLLFGYVEVPCVSDVGSCSYKLCDLLSGSHYQSAHHCPVQVATSSPDFNCACPFVPGDYHLNPTAFEIHPLSALLKWLAQGDYKAEARIIDDSNNEEVGCYYVEGSTIPTGCTGVSCVFGRRK
ncbi:ganglioside GM2 activator-like [Mya arenaria]|uniref:ganglioside GM2 activator-like n=1 Tax=Mya arenaria TaxID=6604 RepID=UPI0022E6590A|nr:ganglioside GM2 activator-like [Mya arenaria]